jgi:hypothetical protein
MCATSIIYLINSNEEVKPSIMRLTLQSTGTTAGQGKAMDLGSSTAAVIV